MLAKKKTTKKNIISIDGKNFDIANLSEKGIAQLDSLHFVNEQILQKNNELQIADSARLMYTSVLNGDLAQKKQ